MLHTHNRHELGNINLEIDDNNNNYININYVDKNNEDIEKNKNSISTNLANMNINEDNISYNLSEINYLKNVYDILFYDKKLKSILEMCFMKKCLMLTLV